MPLTRLDTFWNPDFACLHPAFAQLDAGQFWGGCRGWPDCVLLNSRLAPELCSASGQSIRFVPQDNTLEHAELYYEERIYQHGLIATRRNWHDFFNAQAWLLYPHAKVEVNALHFRDIENSGMGRTRRRDALTLLDENGIVLVGTESELLQAVLDFNWHKVFSAHAAWGRNLGCFVFGHALFQKLLTPYPGLTAHAVLLQAEADFFELELAVQQAWIDRSLADLLPELDTPDLLSPVPVLGIPDWWPQQDETFYADTSYFRPRSRERRARIYELEPSLTPSTHKDS